MFYSLLSCLTVLLFFHNVTFAMVRDEWDDSDAVIRAYLLSKDPSLINQPDYYLAAKIAQERSDRETARWQRRDEERDRQLEEEARARQREEEAYQQEAEIERLRRENAFLRQAPQQNDLMNDANRVYQDAINTRENASLRQAQQQNNLMSEANRIYKEAVNTVSALYKEMQQKGVLQLRYYTRETGS